MHVYYYSSAHFNMAIADGAADVFRVVYVVIRTSGRSSASTITSTPPSRATLRTKHATNVPPGTLLVLKSENLGMYGRIVSRPAARVHSAVFRHVYKPATGGFDMTLVFDQSSPMGATFMVYSGSGLSVSGISAVAGIGGAFMLANSSSVLAAGPLGPAAAVVRIVPLSAPVEPPPPPPARRPPPPPTPPTVMLLSGASYDITLGRWKVGGLLAHACRTGVLVKAREV